MPQSPFASVVRQIRRVVAPSRTADADGLLLERFLRTGDEEAFAVLVGQLRCV